MLTKTEVKANALAAALYNGPSSFGKDEAAAALKQVSLLAKSGKCDDETADAVRAELGNHSQIRQWAVAHGFIKAPSDALENAVSEAIAKLKDAQTELAKKTA